MAEITREPNFWNPASGQSDNVVVTSTAATTIKKGTILLSDGAGKYSPMTTVTVDGVTTVVAIALEEVALTKGGTATIKAIKSGVIGIEPLYEAAGYTTTSAPDYVLDIVGGKSNLVFVHVKEVN